MVAADALLVGPGSRCEQCLVGKLDEQNKAWLCELEEEKRLNSTLSMARTIDEQVRLGAPVTLAVQKVLDEINLSLASVKEDIGRTIKDYVNELRGAAGESTETLRKQVTDVVQLHANNMVDTVKSLLQQGKSASEIENDLKELLGSLNTLLARFQLPNIKGDQKELQLAKALQEAFFANPSVEVQPLGGSDSTDCLVKFKHESIVIGSILVESKSNGRWSNDYAVQVENDLERYHTTMAILCVDSLPRNAKAKGFTVNSGYGIVVVTSMELVVPTITMYYEIHAQHYAVRKKAIDLEALGADRDIVFYLNDTLEALKECKKINDAIDDAKKDIHGCTERLTERIQKNNRKIADILASHRADHKRDSQPYDSRECARHGSAALED
jgi:hypothetical protein